MASAVGSSTFKRLLDDVTSSGRELPTDVLPELAISNAEVIGDSPGLGKVEVRLIDTGRLLSVERAGYPDNWVHSAGDIVSVEFGSDGIARTAIAMESTGRNGDRTDFFIGNKDGTWRYLGSSHRFAAD